MKKLRHFFLTRALREKALLLTFLAIGVGIWISSLNRRAQVSVRDYGRTTAELNVQQQWLSQKAEIEASAAAAVQNLDPSKTFNAARLNAELAAIAAAVGLTRDFQTESPRTDRTNQFSVHTIQFTARRAQFDVLTKFYQELLKRAPYIGIEQFALAADRTNPAQLNASLRVTSVEIAR